MQAIQIREDPNYVDFEATTCQLAVTKFLRLNRLFPGPWNNSDHLLAAAKGLTDQGEYDKFVEWITDPMGTSRKFKFYPIEDTEENHISKANFNAGCVQYACNTKRDGDVLHIHLKNDNWVDINAKVEDEPDEKAEDDVEEEKVMMV